MLPPAKPASRASMIVSATCSGCPPYPPAPPEPSADLTAPHCRHAMRYQAPNSPTSAWARSRSRSSPAASSPPIELTDDVADHLSRGGYVHLCLRVDNLDQTVT